MKKLITFLIINFSNDPHKTIIGLVLSFTFYAILSKPSFRLKTFQILVLTSLFVFYILIKYCFCKLSRTTSFGKPLLDKDLKS
jgi:hypothetical protein